MSFSQQITRFGKKAIPIIQNVRRGVTLKLMTSVIMDTPVDTGRLRANWRLSEHEPNLAQRPGFNNDAEQAAASKAGKKLSGYNNAAIAEVQAGIEASTGDGKLYLVNNLPYAHAIEFDGVSHTKAPEGMVRRNVVRFGRLIQVQIGEDSK